MFFVSCTHQTITTNSLTCTAKLLMIHQQSFWEYFWTKFTLIFLQLILVFQFFRSIHLLITLDFLQKKFLSLLTRISSKKLIIRIASLKKFYWSLILYIYFYFLNVITKNLRIDYFLLHLQTILWMCLYLILWKHSFTMRTLGWIWFLFFFYFFRWNFYFFILIDFLFLCLFFKMATTFFVFA